jgi:hypothetical protein
MGLLETICHRVGNLSLLESSDLTEHCGLDLSIEAPPSVLPQRRYCDITGLEVRESSESHLIGSAVKFWLGTLHGSNYWAALSR